MSVTEITLPAGEIKQATVKGKKGEIILPSVIEKEIEL